MPSKENLARCEMNAGRSTASFFVTPYKNCKRFFSVLMITPLRALSKSLNNLYGSIQNVLAIGITGGKIEDQVNQIAHFYQSYLVKEKMKSPLKVSDVMINARAITIDSVILFFHGIYLSDKKLPLSVVVILLQLLVSMHTTNAIMKRYFAH